MQYAGKQPDELSVVTSWDTAAAENEVHSSGHTHRRSMSLKEIKQPAAQKKRTRTTRQATQTQPALLAAGAFAAALEAITGEDWCRAWAAGRKMMLRRTSKRLKEIVDKIRLPAVVRWRRTFWDDSRDGTDENYTWFSGSSHG
jgi:hypothetical protein